MKTTSHFRRAQLTTLAGLVGLLAACGSGPESTTETGGGDGTDRRPPGDGLARCQSPEGFSVGYPGGWEVNEAAEGVPRCSRFDPERFELALGTDERVAAIAASVEQVPYGDVSIPRGAEAGNREEATIDGRPAKRLSYEVGGSSLYPPGTPVTVYAVDLSEGDAAEPRTLILDTVGLDGFAYERNVGVLDRMARSTEVRADPGPQPGAGSDANGIEPIGPPREGPVEAGEFPAGGRTVPLEDVRAAGHGSFDRVVWEFAGGERPSYRVAYADPPVREAGSGDAVDLRGDAFLEVRLSPASGVDLSGSEPRRSYSGPARIAPDGASLVTEVVRTGDFEAQLAWVVGVDRRRAFAVAMLEEPTRLVVDILERG